MKTRDEIAERDRWEGNWKWNRGGKWKL